jgi:hypothetical protein
MMHVHGMQLTCVFFWIATPQAARNDGGGVGLLRRF